MKIRFLGTSYGAPSIGRHQQSILVETDGGSAYLFDTGAPVLDILVNSEYDLTKIKGIFISHLHGDHMNGLVDILNMTEYFQMEYGIFMPEKRGIDIFREYSLMQLCGYESKRITYELITDGVFYDDGDIMVRAVPTYHMESTGHPSCGFLVESKGVKAYITGDLHPSLKDFPQFLYDEHTDLIIAECAHFSPKELVEKLSRCRTDKAAVIHVMPSERYTELNSMISEVEFELLLPNDNDEYILRR